MKTFWRFVLGVAILKVIFLTGYVLVQQSQRSAANDPQIALAEDTAMAINAGNTPTLAAGSIDIKNSLSPFVIIYDQNRQVVTSSGSLDGTAPTPPVGVFAYANAHGEDRVTWQPQTGVRIASVIKPTDSGFVLAGRSLHEVEQRETVMFQLAAAGFILSVMFYAIIFWLSLPKKGRP